jgi:uracil-DNA glycosylase family protein
VFGEGGAGAQVMLVGEQPGDQEDLRGKPFQGPAGQLLRAAITELGWPAEALYLTNAVKHFHHELRGKRRIHKTPGQQEAAACLHWLEAEIEALRPRAIVALGATALRSLLGASLSITEHDGQWLQRADGLPVLVCLHPAAILRADPSRQAALRHRWVEALGQATPYVLAASSNDGASALAA